MHETVTMPASASGTRLGERVRSLRVASGLLSLGFGLFLIYYIGYVDGLFTDNPKWSPQ